MKTLEDLYYGNIVPQGKTFRNDSQYAKILTYVQRHMDDLNATFTKEQKEIFEKLLDCKDELQSISEVNAFISGFKLAMRIMIEVVGITDDTIIS